MSKILKEQNIICLASAMWSDNWVNAQHIMSRLAETNRVLYIETTGLRAPSTKKGDFNKIIHRLRSVLKGAQKIHTNLYVVPPLTFPLYHKAFIKKFNDFILYLQLKWLTRKLNLENPILWIFLPTGEGLIGKFNEKLSIYYCVDEYSANPGVSKETIISMENNLLQKVDLVVTISPKLYQNKRERNPNTYYLPNVADVEMFTKARNCSETPEDIAKISKPIIGYIGNISNYKVNISILINLAKKNPQWSIVLIGPIGHGDPSTDITSLLKVSNIYLLGSKPYNSLPFYLAAFDVAIIPFHENEYTLSSYPLKFHEYLAAGKKIVTPPLPAFQDYHNIVYFAKTSDEFIDRIKIALKKEITSKEWDCRNEILEAHSWKKRIEDLSTLIIASFNKKL
jgi:hypothetical protein